MNKAVLSAFGLRNGVSHTEFIRAKENGELYFLETSARVGGANIADLIEAASGLNMWAEWAKVEVAAACGLDYQAEQQEAAAGGIVGGVWHDKSGRRLSSFNEPELVWGMKKKHHVGFIVKSPRRERVSELLKLYTERVRRDFHASAPPRAKPGE